MNGEKEKGETRKEEKGLEDLAPISVGVLPHIMQSRKLGVLTPPQTAISSLLISKPLSRYKSEHQIFQKIMTRVLPLVDRRTANIGTKPRIRNVLCERVGSRYANPCGVSGSLAKGQIG